MYEEREQYIYKKALEDPDVKKKYSEYLANKTLESDTASLNEFNKAMQKIYGLGNVDLTVRPKIDMGDGDIATVLSELHYAWQGDDNGGYVGVHVTPILPNGEMLTDDEMADYVNNVLADADNILEADKEVNGGLGIVLKVDPDVGLTGRP